MISKKYAAIDIGSNAMRLLINNVIVVNGEKHYKKADIIRIPIRLGTEAFLNKKISEETIKKMVFALKAYSNLMKAYNVEKYRACATSAMREAENGNEVITQIKEKTGIDIELISGKEEAEIIYTAHIEKFLNKELSFLYLDVGGGSSELTLIDKGVIKASKSFNIGTIRLLNNLVTDGLWEEMKNWVTKVTAGKKTSLIGSGGNINKVFKLSRKQKNESLTYDYLLDYLNTLTKYSYDERVIKLDLNLDRADVIIPALSIFTSVMKWSSATNIFVPKIGLADGIIKLME